MSGGAEMIAGAVVQRVAGMLGEAVLGRVELLWTFKDDVEDMKSKLAIVQAVMVDAENRSRGTDSESVRLWLKKLKSSAYNIEDTIGELEANTMIWRSTPCLGLEFSSVTGLVTLPDAVRCLKSLRKLDILSCVDLETLPEWLGDFSSLREIRINKCPKLSSLPESIHGLTELKKLRIIDCPELFEKCLGEDKHKIAHIPEVITTD